MIRRVALLLYDDVEVLDACGPFEVLSVANRLASRDRTEQPFDIVLVGATEGAWVTARGGLRLAVDTTLRQAPPHPDVLLVPGGVIDSVATDPVVLAWLAHNRGSAELVASIRTGVFVLGAAGLLDQRAVTTHWEDVAELRERWPHLPVRTDTRFIDHGDLATSAGISAGLDLALHLVERFAGQQAARAAARQMDYAWTSAASTPSPTAT